MCRMISALVDRDGGVYSSILHDHFAIVNLNFLLKYLRKDPRLLDDPRLLFVYEFHLDTRTLYKGCGGRFVRDPISRILRREEGDYWMNQSEAKELHDQAAMAFFNDCAGTPEKLIAFVLHNNWDKEELLKLLTPEAMVLYNNICEEASALYRKNEAAIEDRRQNALAKIEDLCKKNLAKAWALYEETCRKAKPPWYKRIFNWASYRRKCREAYALYLKTKISQESQACDEITRIKKIAKKDFDGKDFDERYFLYLHSPVNAWVKLFQDPKNRIPIWR